MKDEVYVDIQLLIGDDRKRTQFANMLMWYCYYWDVVVIDPSKRFTPIEAITLLEYHLPDYTYKSMNGRSLDKVVGNHVYISRKQQ